MQFISKLRNICNKAYNSNRPIALRVSFVSTLNSEGTRIPIYLLSVVKSNTRTVLVSYSRDY